MIVNLLITVDVDNDGIALENERNNLSWQGLERLSDIKRLFQDFKAPVTWFVRADNQLREVYGTPAYLHVEYKELWRDFAATGDEIAWHPHLYQWNERERAYSLDTNEKRCATKLREIHAELCAQALSFESVRMGEAFHGNELMHALSQLGLKVDSTAIPGRRRADEARQFDWLSTPNEPYYPSMDDYRVPGEGDRRLPILEVPLTTIPVRTSYDRAPLKRYINLAYHHPLFRTGLDAYLEDERQTTGPLHVTTILHPEEICPTDLPDALYAHSLREVHRNLAYMLNALRSKDGEVSFWRMGETVDVLAANGDRN